MVARLPWAQEVAGSIPVILTMNGGLTVAGETACLMGPGFAALAAFLRLYTIGSTPSESGSGFVEVSGGSYAAIAISESDFTFSTVSGSGRATLGTKTFTAVGTSITSIGGAYITDLTGHPLAWWPAITPGAITVGSTQTISGLFIGGPFNCQ